MERVKYLEWYDKERKRMFEAHETEMKHYKAVHEAKLAQVVRDLENARGEIVDAKEEAKLADEKVEEMKIKLSILEEEKKRSDGKVQTLIERERREVSKFILYERIRMVKEFKARGSVNWDLEKLEQEFKEEGYSVPSTGESESSSRGEEKVSSVPQALGSGGGKVADDTEGVGDSHDVGGKKADGKDA